MYCGKCGNKNEGNGIYCSYCGEVLNTTNDVVYDKPTENRVWGVFARIGWILGLVGLIGCIYIGIGGFIAIEGIVFSALGKKSKIHRDRAQSGLIMSIIATVVGLTIFFGFYIGLIIFGLSQA